MSIPDSMISWTIAQEYQQREVRNARTADLPDPRPQNNKASDRFATVRQQVSTALRLVADRIKPRPVRSC